MKKINARRLAVIIFLILFAISTYINLRGSYLEYKELGENYISVFSTNLKCEYWVMAINFLLLYIVMYFTGRGIKKGLKVFFNEEKKRISKITK